MLNNHAPRTVRRHPVTIAALLAVLLALIAPSASPAADYTVDYGYDSAYQLTNATYANITTSVDYVYDNMGNRVAKITTTPA